MASHMYRMAILSMAMNNPEVDKTRCVFMALVHDLGEGIAGDITPHCGISEEKKFELEEKARMSACFL